jgi:hypothetical protein
MLPTTEIAAPYNDAKSDSARKAAERKAAKWAALRGLGLDGEEPTDFDVDCYLNNVLRCDAAAEDYGSSWTDFVSDCDWIALGRMAMKGESVGAAVVVAIVNQAMHDYAKYEISAMLEGRDVY